MITSIVALLLIAIGLSAIVLHKTYSLLPVKELKRRARRGDELAKVLYRAASYGASLRALLWAITAITFAVGFLLFASTVPGFLAFVVVVAVLIYGFIWLPAGRVTTFGERFTVMVTPAIVATLHYLQPVLDRMVDFVQAHRITVIRTGLYEREDLLNLLKKQKDQSDNRFSPEELALLTGALTFGQKMVRDVMIPRREVRAVAGHEPVTPMLMKEMHGSGHSRFPVFGESEDKLVGTLYLRDLINLKTGGGTVADIMQPAVFYAHEEYPLEQVLDAFLRTKHQLFVVVNRFEEYIGIITIEDILEQVLGAKIVDEFDHYDDLHAVAVDHARHDHKAHKKDGDEPVEVIAEPPKPENSEESDSSEPPKEVVE